MKPLVSVFLNESKDKLVLLDQTLLPTCEKYLLLKQPEEIWEAIKKLRVRGAPAIGIAAALGLYICLADSKAKSYEDFAENFKKKKEYLASSRPTAVNLFWALNRMEARLKKERDSEIGQIKQALLSEAEAIFAQDQQMCKKIGEYGLSLLEPKMGILTHCNAGGIATSGYGTALAPLFLGQGRGYDFKVFADETRPLLQGSRLTAWELNKMGVDTTVICDNMASLVMSLGKIDAVLVGCDRVAANGDIANKIGTSSVAILAKEYDIPFYVLGPTSTIDISTPTGEQIEIEQRDPDEIGSWFGKIVAPKEVKFYNPAFDVTKAEYITAIITEKGIIYPPFGKRLRKLFA